MSLSQGDQPNQPGRETGSEQRIQKARTRRALVRWLYLVALVHVLVGVVLTWCNQGAPFEAYHQSIERLFWGPNASPAARAEQVWWIALFGATVQSMSLWMGALVHLGNLHRSRFAWGSLIIGLMVWAPQDIVLSLRAGAWAHVWVDSFALLVMLPPLLWLYRHDNSER